MNLFSGHFASSGNVSVRAEIINAVTFVTDSFFEYSFLFSYFPGVSQYFCGSTEMFSLINSSI